VWPELIAELERLWVADYSIFRRGQELFLYLQVPNFGELQRQLAGSEVNRRWQERIAPIFEPVLSLKDGEGLAMMEEVSLWQGSIANAAHALAMFRTLAMPSVDGHCQRRVQPP